MLIRYTKDRIKKYIVRRREKIVEIILVSLFLLVVLLVMLMPIVIAATVEFEPREWPSRVSSFKK